MNAPLACRLIVDSTASGSWQMAVDEVLLESAADSQTASLRFYGWSEPTLSLGYFQAYGEAAAHAPSRGCPVVRRQTGGGAILHDREVTYCLALPVAHPLATDAMRLYLAVHESLLPALADQGITTAQLRAETAPAASRSEPFLCFERRTRGDVLLRATKVCGSAQRRRRGAVLQHGSLLLATSPHAPELPGIAELVGQKLDSRRLVEHWSRAIAERLQLASARGSLTPLELDQVRTLTLEKYSAATWNHRR